MSVAHLQAIYELPQSGLETGLPAQEPHEQAYPIVRTASQLSEKLCRACSGAGAGGILGTIFGIGIGCIIEKQAVINPVATIGGLVIGAISGGIGGWNFKDPVLLPTPSTQVPAVQMQATQEQYRAALSTEIRRILNRLQHNARPAYNVTQPDGISAIGYLEEGTARPKVNFTESGAHMDVDEAEVPPHLLRAQS